MRNGRRTLGSSFAMATIITAVTLPTTLLAGDIYVANIRSNSVSRYDGATGAFKSVFVDPEEGGLMAPTGIAFGPDGNLYVGSSGNHRVLRYHGETGKFLAAFVDGGELQRPFSLVFGPDGNLFVSSGARNVVLRYEGATGRFLNVAASSDDLRQPIGLGFGPDGALYVVNSAGKNILRFRPETGEPLGVFASGNLGFPSDLAFSKDALYVSDARNASIVRFDAQTGAFRNLFGKLPDAGVPVGIAFGDDGRLIAGDFAKGRLFRFEAGGGEPVLLSSTGLSGPENITVGK